MYKININDVKAGLKKKNVKIFVRKDPGDPNILRLRTSVHKKGIETPSILLVPFASSDGRTDLVANFGRAYRDANNNFTLRMYMPPIQPNNDKFKRVFIIFHGLAESDPATFDDLGWELAYRKKIPSILIPLPSHFSRRYLNPKYFSSPYINESDQYKFDPTRGIETKVIMKILQEVAAKPAAIYHGYKQILNDAGDIIADVQNPQEPFWSSIFNSECHVDISLFGYSIGGFAVLALTMLDSNKYKSAFLLESGAFLDQVDAGILFQRKPHIQNVLWEMYIDDELKVSDKTELLFSPREKLNLDIFSALRESKDHPIAFDKLKSIYQDDAKSIKFLSKCERNPNLVFERSLDEGRDMWKDVIKGLYQCVSRDINLQNPQKEDQIFMWIFTGSENQLYKDELLKLSSKILIITGGADDIFSTRLILDSGPKTGLPLLQLPGLDHWIKRRDRADWKKWQGTVLDLMDTFPNISTV